MMRGLRVSAGLVGVTVVVATVLLYVAVPPGGLGESRET